MQLDLVRFSNEPNWSPSTNNVGARVCLCVLARRQWQRRRTRRRKNTRLMDCIWLRVCLTHSNDWEFCIFFGFGSAWRQLAFAVRTIYDYCTLLMRLKAFGAIQSALSTNTINSFGHSQAIIAIVIGIFNSFCGWQSQRDRNVDRDHVECCEQNHSVASAAMAKTTESGAEMRVEN